MWACVWTCMWTCACMNMCMDVRVCGHACGNASGHACGHVCGHARGHMCGHVCGRVCGHVCGHACGYLQGHACGHAFVSSFPMPVQSLPQSFACCVTFLMRSCFLVLQSQAPHAVHSLSQSFGLQAHSQGFFCFSNLSHFLPPHAAAFTIFSSRSCFPSVSPVLPTT